ncbi:hypothetical protein ACGH6R_02280 [Gilliamella sp. CG13]|uniref:hypothetical protein n=1 Tax=Gilliamella sp. CG13 TaxID=3351502 RepID=UPI003985FDEC
MQWKFPNIPEKALPKNFSIFLYLLVFVVSIAIFAFVVILINAENILPSLGLSCLYFVIAPLCFGLSITGIVYNIYHHKLLYVLFFNKKIESKHEQWQNWTRQSIWLVDSQYLTDIENLGLKIMGLEGSQPMNPEKQVPISTLHNLNSSAFFYVFEKILIPMKKKINQFSNIKVQLNTLNNSDLAMTNLINFCHSNNISIRDSNISASDQIPSPKMINEWVDEYDNQTTLIINLMFDVKNSLPFSEYCCALLFSNEYKASKLSKLRVFRPLTTKLTDLSDDIEYLIKAEQVDKKQVRQLWAAHLPSSALNILKGTFLDNNSEIIIEPNKLYHLDDNLGVLDDSHAWLTLSLAAEAVNQGQKGQMVVAQCGDEIHIMQLYDKNMQPSNQKIELFILPVVYLISIISLLFTLIALIPANENILMTCFIIIFVAAVALAFIIPVSQYGEIKTYEHEFQEIWSSELAKLDP